MYHDDPLEPPYYDGQTIIHMPSIHQNTTVVHNAQNEETHQMSNTMENQGKMKVYGIFYGIPIITIVLLLGIISMCCGRIIEISKSNGTDKDYYMIDGVDIYMWSYVISLAVSCWGVWIGGCIVYLKQLPVDHSHKILCVDTYWLLLAYKICEYACLTIRLIIDHNVGINSKFGGMVFSFLLMDCFLMPPLGLMDWNRQIPDNRNTPIPDNRNTQIPDNRNTQIPDNRNTQIPDNRNTQIPDNRNNWSSTQSHKIFRGTIRSVLQYSETCCICLDEYQDDDYLYINKCGHHTHLKCGDMWVTHSFGVRSGNGMAARCPICRSVF
jgi:hypothetical protein